ncbi:MAG: CoA ester lyase [Burkholderiales bacterium]|nr:CoA ester lyase [Burkholderiales bacterium]
MTAEHPRHALFEPEERVACALPVCDHYSGVEPRMRKSLALQAELGPVFDVTLDGEDGAPVGGEVEHAQLMAELVDSADNRWGRVGVRLPALEHLRFDEVVDGLVQRAGARLAYLALPKLRGLADLQRAADKIDAACRRHGLARAIPLHGLVETHGALREVQALAAHPRVESLSFGLMDFVSAHGGAIPAEAMSAAGQFDHPLVLRAKLEIAAACHGHAKTPSHGVVTEFNDLAALKAAATQACRRLGYTRMWSIHPAQIRPIVEAFAPSAQELALAIELIGAAQAARWAPIRHRHDGQDRLHDRASYRYYWQLIERAERSAAAGGPALPANLRAAWFGPA